MSRSPAWLAGGTAIVGSVGCAAAYVAMNDWFGVGDLRPMVLWSVPLGVAAAFAVGGIGGRLATARSRWWYATLLPLGAALGLLWTVIVALLLGAWIGTFSFPVLLCWAAGGSLGGITAAGQARPHTWPAALAAMVLVLLGYGRLGAYARAPEPRVHLIVRRDIPRQDVERVWTEVVGRRTGRGDERDLLPGISSVGASGYEGGNAVFTVSFLKGLSRVDRESLVTRMRRSPLILRVDPVAATESPGVRAAVSY